MHKRGFLFHGIPGCGKSTILWQLSNMIGDSVDGVSLLAQCPSEVNHGIKAIRAVTPRRPVMVIVEDFDDASDGNKSAWLNLLDGGFSFDRVCFIATTNFLDKIDSRFTNRPSRFDRIIEIECPDSTDRANYFISKIPDVTAVELSGLIAHTNGMTYAQMREVIVWTQCLQRPIGDVVKHIQDMEEAVEGE